MIRTDDFILTQVLVAIKNHSGNLLYEKQCQKYNSRVIAIIQCNVSK